MQLRNKWEEEIAELERQINLYRDEWGWGTRIFIDLMFKAILPTKIIINFYYFINLLLIMELSGEDPWFTIDD